jgi:tetratricopeptide (TPR) repeat protein
MNRRALTAWTLVASLTAGPLLAPAQTEPAATQADEPMALPDAPLGPDPSATTGPATDAATLPAETADARPSDDAPAPEPQDPAPAIADAAAPADDTDDAAATQPSQAALLADAMLAEHLCEIAQNSLRVRELTPAALRRSAALFEIASRLNPNEPRFHRHRAEVMTQFLKDPQGALDALNAYRKLVPDDEMAQTQVIELHALGMETADARVAYLNRIVDHEAVAPTVRSYAAVLLARLYSERGQQPEMLAALDRALRLNPLNLAALEMRYEAVTDGRPPAERAAAQLAMLRANPMHLTAVMLLAETCAEVGLLDASLRWYNYGYETAPKLRQPYTARFATGYATTLFVAGQPASAAQFAEALVQADPQNVEAWMLRLLIDQSLGNADALADNIDRTYNAIRNRMAVLRRSAGDELATTRPVEAMPQPIADPAGELQRIQAAGREDVTAAYIEAMTDLAWLEIYFKRKPDNAAAIIEAVAGALPKDSPVVARLQGWSYLVANRLDEAKVKLSGIEKTDVLAALGMIRVNEQTGNKAAADAAARRLMSENPSGRTGAILWEALQNGGVRVVPGRVAQDVAEELMKFPLGWLEIVDKPHLFYAVRADPLQVVHQFGQPMFLRVTVTNINAYDLTIGSDGVLRPDLFFDGFLRGAQQEQFPGVAFERLSQRIVLHPRQTVDRIVRFDQGTLGIVLEQAPSVAIQVGGTVTTNPIMTPDGVTAGAAGYRVQLLRLLERVGTPIQTSDQKQELYLRMSSGNPLLTMSGMHLLTTYASAFRRSEEADRLAAQAAEFAQRVERMSFDDVPGVAAWGAYLTAALASPAQRPARIEEMLKSPHWQQRALAIAATYTLPPEASEPLLKKIAETEQDEGLKRLAELSIEAVTATTQPAAPATLPSGN